MGRSWDNATGIYRAIMLYLFGRANTPRFEMAWPSEESVSPHPLTFYLVFALEFATINFMLWLSSAAYGVHRIPVFIAIVLAQFIGALLLFQFQQGWKR